ncbi:hypothetical protein N2152v2_009730 [Parachlorella kessleri]
MRAVVLNEPAKPQAVTDFPVPKRRPGTVLIKTVSVGVNPVDLYVRGHSAYPPYDVKDFPKVLGGDVAGIVEEAEEGSKFKKGDKVFALTPGYWIGTTEGCYAEYVVAEEGWVARVPDNLPLDEAAGVPLVSLTSWQALNQVEPKAGQRVLITAAAGGLGHIMVQIAKTLGLTVVGISGPKNLDWVKSLGADEVVDYTKQDVSEVYKDNKFDLAIDPMGTRGGLLTKTLSVLKPSGHYVDILSPGTDESWLGLLPVGTVQAQQLGSAAKKEHEAGKGPSVGTTIIIMVLEAAKKEHEAGKGPSVGTILVQPNGEQLQHIADLISEGKVRVTVGQKLPLEEFEKAHDQIATGHTRGKVVLTLLETKLLSSLLGSLFSSFLSSLTYLTSARRAGLAAEGCLVASLSGGGEIVPRLLSPSLAPASTPLLLSSVQFKKGDKVFALTPGFFIQTPEGCYAEYVVAEEGWVARVPDNLPLDEAAGVPLVALTSWQALHQVEPKAGQRVLITAAAGGVGHIAVQIAKTLGLTVVGVVGPKNLDWVKSLGADEVVDYTQQDVSEVYKDNKFDLVVDPMGTRSDLLSKTLSVLKPSGHYAHIMSPGTDQSLLEAARKEHEAGKGPSVGTTFVQSNGEQLQHIADLISEGKVKLTVAEKYPLEEFEKAHDQIATGHTRGKLVLTL